MKNTIIALLLLACACAPASALARKRALVVGVSNYAAGKIEFVQGLEMSLGTMCQCVRKYNRDTNSLLIACAYSESDIC